MKKILIIGLIAGILVIGIIAFFLLHFSSEEENNVGQESEIFCADYDGNQQECLSYSECKWSSDINECDSTDMVDENYEGLNQELENIAVPNNPSNTLCKKIPLSGKPPYGERYYCLAVVNHDERFCEGIDEEKGKNICLAHAKADPSYCKKIQEDSAKHVCYYMLAVSSKNADFCSDISYSQHEKEQCYFNFMSNLYQWDKSDEIKTEYCNQLGTPDKNTCLALKARDISLCGDNPHCLTFFGQDLSFCDEHPEIDGCIKDRAKTSKNVSICELLPQPDRDSCVGVYCTHTELDVNICDRIEGIKERQDRYIELAMNLGNW
ncbi:MAG: hypothetical protein PHW01_03265 [Patescibacteria group bacterium]|nr:hypothetical protein [Patescibacteria group bacterium]